jgi:serine/threonine-protein kinase
MPFLGHAQREVSIEAIQALANLVDEGRASSLITTLKELQESPDQTIARISYFSIEVIESRIADVMLAAGGGGAVQGTRPPGGTRGATRGGATGSSGLRPRPLWPPAPADPTGGEAAGALVPFAAPAPGLDIQHLKAGDVLEGRYRYIERIGRGAFGTVLLTEDTVVGEQLILKFINQNLATDDEVMRRFVHELRYSRRVTHQNVIRIYDFHNIQGSYAISMEYFASHTLGAELVHQQPLPPARVLKLAIDICNGMEAAHEQGIVHRDLKPANVLINDDDWLKIVDFGVAAAWREHSSDDLTGKGFVIGSPKYMAPEQIAGKKVDHRADIYALGVILYEMSTGVPPYDGRDHVTIMFSHVQGKARPPAELNPALSPDFSALIMQAMALDKRRRFQSMAELRAALQQHF